jgi:hypothetical protein
MSNKPKKIYLFISGIISLICARALFFLVDDPEGPNLLIVVVAGAIIFGVIWVFLSLTGIKRYF